MNILLRGILGGLFFLLQQLSYGQTQIKETTILAYKIHNQDSTLHYRKTSNYDLSGRLINKQNYYYHYKNRGILVKEEKAFFNLQDNWLIEEIITYSSGKEPIRQKLKTKYLDYQAKEKDSKYILRQLYDQYGELSKEDTLTYDEQNNIIGLCKYNYRGSTSLFCNYYTYKNNLQTRWTTYSKWTTIDIKGRVVQRQGKRRDYKYKYNKNGQLVHACGKYYKTRFHQTIKYDKNNKLLKNRTVTKRRVNKGKGTKDKPAKKKYRIDKEETILTYEDGRLVKEIRLINKKERNRKEVIYQDTFIQAIQIKLNGVTIEEINNQYNDQNKIVKKINNKYQKNGKLRYSVITLYNAEEKPIREEQVIGTKSLSLLEIEYDKHGNPISKSLSSQNTKSLEKTLYIYKYY